MTGPATTRRSLLGSMAVGAAALATGCGAEGRRGATGKKFVVVGGGMAGLGAARVLRNAGSQVVVVEARERIGGRVHTVGWQGARVDLGAAWIHDSRGNPLTAIAEQAGLRTVATAYDRIALRRPDGRAIERTALARALRARDSIVERLYRLSWKEGAKPLGPALREMVEARVRVGVDRTALEWLLGVDVPLDWAADPGEISIEGFAEGTAYRGGPDLLIEGGAGQLVDWLARDIPLRKGSPVRKISRSRRGVRVTLASGEVIQCDGCVVTVPLGVLKAGAVRFEPALPESHRRAIGRLGFGLLDKTFLSYGSTWWPSNETQLGTVGGGIEQTISVFTLDGLTGEPLLCGFTGAGFARRLETSGPEGATPVVVDRLRQGFGGHAVPDASLSTRWAKDRFARGSYSFLAVGSSSRDRAMLASPVGRVVLAGEHTSTDRPATMDGALIAGRHAARRLLGRFG